MKTPSWLITTFALVVSLALGACAEDEPPPLRTSLIAPTPRAMSNDVRGLWLMYSDTLRGVDSQLEIDRAVSRHAVVYDQIYSEFTHARIGGAQRAPEPRFESRLGGLYEDERLGPVVAEFDSVYWVVDLFRLDREWLVDWDGLERDVEGVRAENFTFGVRAESHGSDYQTAVIAQIAGALERSDPRPRSIILGTEMERHYLNAPEDWPAFVSFVDSTVRVLREVEGAADLRVSVGFNWSTFIDQVVPQFLTEADAGVVNFQVIRRAWEAVIDPVVFDIDEESELRDPRLSFYAFSSIPDVETRYASPGDIDPLHFAGIPTYFDEFRDRALPVAWFQVGWPSSSSSSDFWGQFFDVFLSRTGGYDVELIAWWGFAQLNESECNTMTGNRVGVGRWICTRGLYSPSASPSNLTLLELFL